MVLCEVLFQAQKFWDGQVARAHPACTMPGLVAHVTWQVNVRLDASPGDALLQDAHISALWALGGMGQCQV